MKRLKGGIVLLDLCALSLLLDDGVYDITDAGVLEQLTELANFIDENRDYSKKANGLKPVAIEYRSEDDEINGIAVGNMSFNDDALHMSMAAHSVQSDGTSIDIIINVVYEWVEYVGYSVDGATIQCVNNDKVKYNPETQVFEVGTSVYVDGNAEVDGDTTLNGDVTITGDAKLFENIVDKDGNKRFIEGDIELTSSAIASGITKMYGKWSLNGSNLMIVLAFDVAENLTISAGNLTTNLTIPEWVKDKIYILYSNVVIAGVVTGRKDDGTQITISGFLTKDDVTKEIQIYCGSFTTNANTHFRIQYDLLIDNE